MNYYENNTKQASVKNTYFSADQLDKVVVPE